VIDSTITSSSPRDALFRLLVDSVQEYAIFLMDPEGIVRTWNLGAQRVLGYTASEIIGKHHSVFYPPAEMRHGKPEYVLRMAADEGTFEEENWRVRKDGTRIWAGVAITHIEVSDRPELGFAKVVRDLTERKQAEDDRMQLLGLEREARTRAETLLEQLQAVQSVTEAALAHLNLDDLLNTLLDRMSEALQVDTVAVLLLSDDGPWLVPKAAKGIEEEVEAGFAFPSARVSPGASPPIEDPSCWMTSTTQTSSIQS